MRPKRTPVKVYSSFEIFHELKGLSAVQKICMCFSDVVSNAK